MRTSNKLLLGFVLLVFGTFLAIHGVLYGKYRKADFITDQQLRTEEFIRYAISKPRVISFDGTIWVNLIPADSFALELPRINKDPDAGMFDYGPRVNLKEARQINKALTYHEKDDTLFVSGNTAIPVHRPFSPWYYRRQIPQVNYYAPSFDNILLNNGQLCLRGKKSGYSPAAHLIIRNSTLWIGMQYETIRHDLPENFDSLDITSINSSIVLNGPARINHVNADLKDSSVITDQYSSLNFIDITSSPGSRIDLTGDSWKKSRIIIHP